MSIPNVVNCGGGGGAGGGMIPGAASAWEAGGASAGAGAGALDLQSDPAPSIGPVVGQRASLVDPPIVHQVGEVKIETCNQSIRYPLILRQAEIQEIR